MEANKLKQIKAHANAIAELLYTETDSEQVKRLEGIEEAVRKHSLAEWVSQQPSSNPLICLGDGHQGIWNILAILAIDIQILRNLQLRVFT